MQALGQKRQSLLGYSFLVFTGINFGTLEVISKLMKHLAPMQMSFLRFLIGGLVILPFGLLDVRRRKTPVRVSDLFSVTLLGTLLIPVSMTLLQFSVTKVAASLVAFIFSANPMIIATFAAIVLKERLGKVEAAFIALGMTGMALIVRPFGAGFDANVLYPLASVLLFGLYIVLARKLSRKLGSLFVTSSAILAGSLVLGIYASATGLDLLGGISSGDYIYLAYLGIVVSGLAYVTYFRGMDMTSTNTGSIVFFIKALVAAVLSAVSLGEVLSASVYAGAACIALGIFVMVIGNAA
ncbi:MAG TPA: DMT family transporter, partial [Bacillota bacterium]|nr:DMT family transporter [Bacillota bacterium]